MTHTGGNVPDTKIHEANMGPIWGRQDPGGPHVGPTNFAIWGVLMVPSNQFQNVRYRNEPINAKMDKHGCLQMSLATRKTK